MGSLNLQSANIAECLASCDNDELFDVEVQNNSANDVYLGGASVSTSDYDCKIDANGGSYTIQKRKMPIYAVSATANTQIQVRKEIYRIGSR